MIRRLSALLLMLALPVFGQAQQDMPATYAAQAGAVLQATSQEEFLVIDPSDVIKGDLDAPLTIYEFSSFTCPHCGNLHQNVLPQIYADFIDTGKAKLVFRDFPLDQFAVGIGLLGQCMTAREDFFSYVELVFANQQAWRQANTPFADILGYAEQSGLSQDQALACLQNQSAIDFITERRRLAAELVGVQGTPTMVLADGTRLTSSDADIMAAELEEAFKAATAK